MYELIMDLFFNGLNFNKQNAVSNQSGEKQYKHFETRNF